MENHETVSSGNGTLDECQQSSTTPDVPERPTQLSSCPWAIPLQHLETCACQTQSKGLSGILCTTCHERVHDVCTTLASSNLTTLSEMIAIKGLYDLWMATEYQRTLSSDKDQCVMSLLQNRITNNAKRALFLTMDFMLQTTTDQLALAGPDAGHQSLVRRNHRNNLVSLALENVHSTVFQVALLDDPVELLASVYQLCTDRVNTDVHTPYAEKLSDKLFALHDAIAENSTDSFMSQQSQAVINTLYMFSYRSGQHKLALLISIYIDDDVRTHEISQQLLACDDNAQNEHDLREDTYNGDRSPIPWYFRTSSAPSAHLGMFITSGVYDETQDRNIKRVLENIFGMLSSPILDSTVLQDEEQKELYGVLLEVQQPQVEVAYTTCILKLTGCLGRTLSTCCRYCMRSINHSVSQSTTPREAYEILYRASSQEQPNRQRVMMRLNIPETNTDIVEMMAALGIAVEEIKYADPITGSYDTDYPVYIEKHLPEAGLLTHYHEGLKMGTNVLHTHACTARYPGCIEVFDHKHEIHSYEESLKYGAHMCKRCILKAAEAGRKTLLGIQDIRTRVTSVANRITNETLIFNKSALQGHMLPYINSMLTQMFDTHDGVSLQIKNALLCVSKELETIKEVLVAKAEEQVHTKGKEINLTGAVSKTLSDVASKLKSSTLPVRVSHIEKPGELLMPNSIPSNLRVETNTGAYGDHAHVTLSSMAEKQPELRVLHEYSERGIKFSSNSFEELSFTALHDIYVGLMRSNKSVTLKLPSPNWIVSQLSTRITREQNLVFYDLMDVQTYFSKCAEALLDLTLVYDNVGPIPTFPTRTADVDRHIMLTNTLTQKQLVTISRLMFQSVIPASYIFGVDDATFERIRGTISSPYITTPIWNQAHASQLRYVVTGTRNTSYLKCATCIVHEKVGITRIFQEFHSVCPSNVIDDAKLLSDLMLLEVILYHLSESRTNKLSLVWEMLDDKFEQKYVAKEFKCGNVFCTCYAGHRTAEYVAFRKNIQKNMASLKEPAFTVSYFKTGKQDVMNRVVPKMKTGYVQTHAEIKAVTKQVIVNKEVVPQKLNYNALPVMGKKKGLQLPLAKATVRPMSSVRNVKVKEKVVVPQSVALYVAAISTDEEVFMKATRQHSSAAIEMFAQTPTYFRSSLKNMLELKDVAYKEKVVASFADDNDLEIGKMVDILMRNRDGTLVEEFDTFGDFVVDHFLPTLDTNAWYKPIVTDTTFGYLEANGDVTDPGFMKWRQFTMDLIDREEDFTTENIEKVASTDVYVYEREEEMPEYIEATVVDIEEEEPEDLQFGTQGMC